MEADPTGGPRATKLDLDKGLAHSPETNLPGLADEGFISFLKVVNSQGEGGAVGPGMQCSAWATPADAARVA